MATIAQEKPVRSRLWIVATVVAIAGLVVVIAVLLASSAGPPPPAAGSASLVPADALAYVHVSIDRHRPEVARGERLATRLPDYPVLAAAVTSRLSTLLGAGVSLDFARQIRPWLGREAAFAVLNTTGATASTLIVLDVRRAGPLLYTGAVPDGSYRSVRLYRGQSATELAFVGRYLVVGQDVSVRAAIDVARGRARSLAQAPAYRAAAAGEPVARVLDAYVSAAGVQRLLAPRGGALGALAVLLSQPGFRAATIAISPASGGASIRVHSALLRQASRPPAPTFAPTLGRVLPAGSPLVLDVADLTRAAPKLLATTAQLGLVSNLGPLLARLGAALSAEGVNVRSVLSIFSGETALMLTGESNPAHPGTPAVTLVARARRPRAARQALAALEAPLAQLFTPAGSSAGLVPEWSDQAAGAVTARQFAFSPGLQLDYAVFDGLVVVSTSLRGISAIADTGRSLAAQRAYRDVFADRPSSVTSLLFLDFSQLLSLGEQTGLVHGSFLRRLTPDLEQIRAAGASSTSGEADTTAELFLQIP